MEEKALRDILGYRCVCSRLAWATWNLVSNDSNNNNSSSHENQKLPKANKEQHDKPHPHQGVERNPRLCACWTSSPPLSPVCMFSVTFVEAAYFDVTGGKKPAFYTGPQKPGLRKKNNAVTEYMHFQVQMPEKQEGQHQRQGDVTVTVLHSFHPRRSLDLREKELVAGKDIRCLCLWAWGK